MGTAAFAATATPLLKEPFIPREDRYLSYNIGGGSEQYTVNNFLRLYNPNINGSATGRTLPLDGLSLFGHHMNPFLRQVVGLDAALTGALVQDIPQEIEFLVSQLNTIYADSVDFKNSWKMATLFIGANNLCVACNNNTRDYPEEFGRVLNQSIAQLHESIPRVRLNLLPIFNLTQVWAWARSDPYCTRVWDIMPECPCLQMWHPSQKDRQAVNDYAVQYRKEISKVAAYWQSLGLTDFSVTVQPFLQNMKIINSALTSNFDCFHPSEIGHSWFAAGLWNSLWLPPSQKPTNVTDMMVNGMELICPGRNTYMQ